MRCAGAYKCLRSPRASRLNARTATSAQTSTTRTLHKISNKNNNTCKQLTKNNKIKVNKRKHKKSLDMNDAELYQQSNKLQKRDALQCLKEYEKKFRWKRFERVLDIGCGDGGVTTEILKRFIPGDFASLTGCDISEKMVCYANDHHGDDRITFQVLDIAGSLPPHFKASFEHAYSFYTLHWIHDQDRAFKNIYDLLAEDGECLLIFLGHMPLFDVFRSLARRPKWREWLRDVDRFVSPYHDSQDPEKEIKRRMARTGFKDIDVQIKEKSFVYNGLQDCRNAVSAVNPFKMSSTVKEEFLDDYLQLVRDMRLIDKANNNLEEMIRMNYTLIVAYGKKEGTRTGNGSTV